MPDQDRALSLSPERLRWRCDPDQLGYETTDDVAPLGALVGQDRGLDAIAFALDQDVPGYNLYVAGPTGTGRTTAVRDRLRPAAAARPAPPDWCYLHNFRDPSRPLAVSLPPGRGPELARDLDGFIAGCRREIPKILESEAHQRRRAAVRQALQEQRERVFARLHDVAEGLGFAVEVVPTGIVPVPLLAPGKPLSPEAFELLPEARQAEIRLQGQQLQQPVDEALLTFRRLERDAQEQLQALDREAALFAVGHELDALRAKHAAQPRIGEYLDAVRADLVEHLDEFGGEDARPGRPFPVPGRGAGERYRVNVLVTHDPAAGGPVVFEPNPTYYHLVGRVDYRAAVGAMYTDLTLIKPGALHRASGGFLVLEARDVLRTPFAWDALKRALRDAEVRVENPGEQLSVFPSEALRPEPVPLAVKVVLIGDLTTYALLHALDDDFRRLFKVKAQFGAVMDRTPAAVGAYAAFVGDRVREHHLLPFDKGAIARVIEHGARLVEHQERLATCFDAVAELVVEADHWARRAGAGRVLAGHVEQATAAAERRANLLEEEARRAVREGTVAIETRGAAVGQVNGLSVIDLGDYAFAHPTRITARSGLGAEGVVDIEREAKLSGPAHSKGVLILGGYLLGAYAADRPLAVSARLAFEQVYSEVDGDSASSAELYALLSSLAGLPLAQGIAVTGSVNQRGEIQAVGGVTAKAEGFYAACQDQGLTGDQGVVIPAANARHLMLKPEVVEAVAQGRFHVWAVRTVDEGLELLTGVPAGERRADGSYPEGTVHGLVQQRLAAMAARLAEFGGARPAADAHGTSAPVDTGDGRAAGRPPLPAAPGAWPEPVGRRSGSGPPDD
jgi:predicted ATP-dependent protease